MNKKTKTFTHLLPVKKPWGAYTIMIYGELWQSTEVDGVAVIQCKYSRDGQRVLSFDPERGAINIITGSPHLKTKSFNMGWAICSPDDKFDEEYGIELCKKRFHRKPLTTQSGTFLTHDMICAIMKNEAEYIEKHFDEYVPKVKNCANEDAAEDKCTGKKCDDAQGTVENKEEVSLVDTLRPNTYVILTSKGGVNSGLVHSVNGKKVHFYFITGHDGDFKKFLRYSSDGSLTADIKFVDHVANAKETATELEVLAKNHNVRWDAEKKRLVRIK